MATLDLGLLKVTIGGDTSGLDKAEADAKTKLNNIKKSSDDTTEAMIGHAKKMSAAFVLAMGAVTAAIASAVSSGAQMGNLATSLGLTVEQLSRLEYAAKTAGLGADQLKGAVSELSKKMLEREPVDLGVRLFNALGVSVRDASGNMRNTLDVLTAVADRFSKMRDGAEKTSLAMQLFGGEGAALIPILNQGAEGLNKLFKESDQLGNTIDGKTAESFKNFMNEVNRTRAAIEAIFTRVAANLQPALSVLNDVLFGATTKTKEFGGASEGLTSVLKGTIAVATALGGAINVVYQSISAVVEAMYNIAKGEFSKAWEAITRRVENVVQTFEAAERVSNALFSGWETSVNKTADAIKKAAPPIIESVESVTRRMDEFKNTSRMAMEDLMNMPTETVANKMAALEDMVRRGGISWREYLGAVRQVNAGSKQQMNDLLSATSQVLTSLFNRSKAAAIASALINTYQGITKAIAEYPPPISYAMAAAQAALGFAQVRAITSQSATGGGGGAAPTAAPTPSIASSPQSSGQAGGGGTLFVQGFSADGFFSGDAVRSLAQKLLEYQRDGGKVVLA